MKTNIKVLGWLFIVMGALGLLIACGIAGLLGAIGVGVSFSDAGPEAPALLGVAATVIMIITLVLCIPNIIVGIGLLRFRSWARVLGIVLAVLNLTSFPLGTVFGIYALVSLLIEDTEVVFD